MNVINACFCVCAKFCASVPIKYFNQLSDSAETWDIKLSLILWTGREGASVVAVKTLKDNASDKERDDLKQELHVMKMLEPHANVVRLLGCCTEKGEFQPSENFHLILRGDRNGKINLCSELLNDPKLILKLFISWI